MRIALIADTFPPLRTSGAVQLRDLSREFVQQGHQLTVMLPCSELTVPWRIDQMDGVEVLRLRSPRTKDIGYIRRTLAELLMPFFMRYNLNKSPLSHTRWDGVVWYSPSIFHGPLVRLLKKTSGCKAYLIIRDIFPEWAVDMGLMGRGLPYRFFKAVANYQYSMANVIGVQTPGNLGYFQSWVNKKPGNTLEVLNNWLGAPTRLPCPIRLNDTPLAGRTLFVYAGNMGIAQGMDILLELADQMKSRKDVGFVFVGRGSDANRLKKKAKSLSNTLFFDEIHPDEIPDLYAQCHVGMVALDPRHKSHNIPGKFLTYMQCGLPVLANINAGNDLAALIRDEKVGQVCETNKLGDLLHQARTLIEDMESEPNLQTRCTSLFQRTFSAPQAVQQVVAALR